MEVKSTKSTSGTGRQHQTQPHSCADDPRKPGHGDAMPEALRGDGGVARPAVGVESVGVSARRSSAPAVGTPAGPISAGSAPAISPAFSGGPTTRSSPPTSSTPPTRRSSTPAPAWSSTSASSNWSPGTTMSGATATRASIRRRAGCRRWRQASRITRGRLRRSRGDPSLQRSPHE